MEQNQMQLEVENYIHSHWHIIACSLAHFVREINKWNAKMVR